jgi:hypothetical protein
MYCTSSRLTSTVGPTVHDVSHQICAYCTPYSSATLATKDTLTWRRVSWGRLQLLYSIQFILISLQSNEESESKKTWKFQMVSFISISILSFRLRLQHIRPLSWSTNDPAFVPNRIFISLQNYDSGSAIGHTGSKSQRLTKFFHLSSWLQHHGCPSPWEVYSTKAGPNWFYTFTINHVPHIHLFPNHCITHAL